MRRRSTSSADWKLKSADCSEVSDGRKNVIRELQVPESRVILPSSLKLDDVQAVKTLCSSDVAGTDEDQIS